MNHASSDLQLLKVPCLLGQILLAVDKCWVIVPTLYRQVLELRASPAKELLRRRTGVPDTFPGTWGFHWNRQWCSATCTEKKKILVSLWKTCNLIKNLCASSLARIMPVYSITSSTNRHFLGFKKPIVNILGCEFGSHWAVELLHWSVFRWSPSRSNFQLIQSGVGRTKL